MARQVLAVVHVYYPEFWEELAACVGNLSDPCDLVVTYVDEAAVAAARRDFPNARFIRCENRGFDVWPFLKALGEVDLAKYDLVVKLHTKRDIDPSLNFRFNRMRFAGPAWRERLLAFCRTPEAWQSALRRFDSRSVGMVASREVIVRRRDVNRQDAFLAYDAAVREMAAVGGRSFDPARATFVAGTMFAVRSEILRFLLRHDFTSGMFAASAHVTVEDLEYAHVVERMLGLAVFACGFRIVAFDAESLWRRLCRRLVR